MNPRDQTQVSRFDTSLPTQLLRNSFPALHLALSSCGGGGHHCLAALCFPAASKACLYNLLCLWSAAAVPG